MVDKKLTELPTGAIVGGSDLFYSSQGFTSVKQPASALRDFVASAITIEGRTRITNLDESNFYIATNGSNSNDGRTPETPWLTLQHAVNEIVTKYYVAAEDSVAVAAVFLNIADGTYSTLNGTILPPFGDLGFPQFIITGNQTNPENVIFNIEAGGDTGCLGCYSVLMAWGSCEYLLTGISFDASLDAQPATNLLQTQRGSAHLHVENCRFGKCGSAGGGNAGAVYADAGAPSIMMQGNWVYGIGSSLLFAYGEHTNSADVQYLHYWLRLEVDPLWPGGCVSVVRNARGWFHFDEALVGSSSGLKARIGQGSHLFVPGGLAKLPGTGIIQEGGVLNVPGGFSYDPINGLLPAGGTGTARTRLTTVTQFYVATTGVDSNDGLTAGTPWKTIQHAVNTIVQNYYIEAQDTISTAAIFLNIADGTYTTPSGLVLPAWGDLGNPQFIIQGNDTNPQNVIINVTDSGGAGAVIYAEGPSEYYITGISVDASTDVQSNCDLLWVQRGSAQIHLVNSRLGKAGNAGGGFHAAVYADVGTPSIYLNVTTIYGTAQGFMFAYGEHSESALIHSKGTLTLSVDPLWPQGCIHLQGRNARAFFQPAVTGTSSGPKAYIETTCTLSIGSWDGVPGTGYTNNGTVNILTKGKEFGLHQSVGNVGSVDEMVTYPGDAAQTIYPDVPIVTSISDYFEGDLHAVPVWHGIIAQNIALGVKHTGTTDAYINGWYGQVATNADSTGPIGDVNALSATAQNNGSGLCYRVMGATAQASNADGDCTYQYGMRGSAYQFGAGTTTFADGGNFALGSGFGGTITQGNTVHLETPAIGPGGVITDLNGVLIEDHSGIGATTSYNLRSKGAASLNQFDGSVKVEVYSKFGNVGGGLIGFLAPGDPGTGGISEINTAQAYPLLSNNHWVGNLHDLPWEAVGFANFQAATHTVAGLGGVWYYGIDGDYYINSDSIGRFAIAHGTYSAMQNWGSGDVADLKAVYGLGWHQGSGLVTDLWGVQGSALVAAGTATLVRGTEGQINIFGGTTTKAVGLRSVIVKTAGTLATALGLEIEDTAGIGSTASYNVLSKGATSRNIFEGTVESPFLRVPLTANLELYVATTGNDSTGTGASGAPWASIQKAFDYIMQRVDYGNQYSVTVHVAAGTYGGSVAPRLYGPIPGASYNGITLSIDGAVTLSTTDYVVLLVNNADLYVGGTGTLTVVANDGPQGTVFQAGNGANLSIFPAGGVNFVAGTDTDAFLLWTDFGGNLSIFTTITVTGNFCQFATCPAFGTITVSGAVTFSGSVACSSGFAVASRGGDVRVTGSTFTGTLTGKKFDVRLNATLDVAGGAATLPGTVAGTTATGGQAP